METDQQQKKTVDEKLVLEETEDREKSVLSTTSSPSHEFSFTLSLQNSSQSPATTRTPEKPKTAPFAIDLSPADEIFFHGHLLPLHFLSHLRAAASSNYNSPRHSTNSIDAFTLPIKEGINQEDDHEENQFELTITGSNSGPDEPKDSDKTPHTKPNSKPLLKMKKLKYEVSQFVKRYIEKVKPLLSSKGGILSSRREKIKVRRHSYSFSGILSRPKDNNNNREYGFNGRSFRRGEFSAPASMRTSPSNSGHLVATVGVTSSPTSTTHDSTMEELQAAIQAAIAHCKNSIANSDHDHKSVI